MSKLDYITVTIVIICIAAIIFLIYKMTDLFKGETKTDKVETLADSTAVEDDMYDYEIDPEVDSTGTTATDKAANTGASTPATQPPATKPSATTTPTQKEIDASAAPSEDDAGNSNTEAASSGGKFMVLAGSYTKRALANSEVAKLKKKGYNNAKVELFDRGKFAVILVDRFDNMAEAESLVKKLKGDGVASYVKMKERN